MLTLSLVSGTGSALSSPAMRRRAVGPGPGHGVQRVLSSDSISSGYSTDMYLPVDSDMMDTGDYELWERRHPHGPPQEHQYHHPPQQYQHQPLQRQKKNFDRPSNKEVK